MADVTTPLMGYNFLSHFGLVVALKVKYVCEHFSHLVLGDILRKAQCYVMNETD